MQANSTFIILFSVRILIAIQYLYIKLALCFCRILIFCSENILKLNTFIGKYIKKNCINSSYTFLNENIKSDLQQKTKKTFLKHTTNTFKPNSLTFLIGTNTQTQMKKNTL